METMNDRTEGMLRYSQSQGSLFFLLNKMKEEGRLDDIIQVCLKALDTLPDYFPLRHLLAEIYFEEGFFDQAEAELSKVVSDIDSLISVYKLQAEIYTQKKRYKEAFEALKRYLAHKSDDSEALELLKSITIPAESTSIPLEEEDNSSISEVSSGFATGTGDEDEYSEFATPTLAEIFFSQGQINNAIRTYEKILLNDPDDNESKRRLDELKALKSEEPGMKDMKEDKDSVIKVKMISFLEGWLTKIRESKNGT